MFNNRVQNGTSEFEKLLEGPDKKLRLGIGRRIYCDYSFFVSTEEQDRIVNILSLVSKRGKSVRLDYHMIESKLVEQNNTKIELKITFEDAPKSPKECFLYISSYITQIKEIFEPYYKEKFPIEFGMTCSFDIKSQEKYNNVLVEFLDDKEKVEYKEKLLPSKFTRCTEHINYNVNVYKSLIVFYAYTGNIIPKGLCEIFFEIANNIIQFNNEVILRIKS